MSAPATILDMCCGSRMFWFDKSDERAGDAANLLI
ncbi:methyltransferase [Escherichia coli]|nr:methyltransferase [Escherichia coli]MDK2518499.1 methyltransferase [Escherichia coli]